MSVPNPFAPPPVAAVPLPFGGAMGAPTAPARPVDPDDTKTNADLTEEYINLRDEKREIQERHKEELEPLQARMNQIEAKMLARLDREGVQSVKTTKGTAFKKTSTTYKIGDAEVLFPWIEANGRTDMLAKSIRPDAMREYAEEHKTLPPGVEATSFTVVQFRK